MKIIGHEKQLEFLKKSIKNNTLSQAYLFYGPVDIGKKKVAKEFAKDILSIDTNNGQEVKEQVQKGSHPDLKIVKPNKKGSIKISQTRDIIDSLNKSPFSAQKRVVIIEGAENMTNGAANSILKFLEEPPAYVHIILTTKNKDLLPATIVSRCQLLRFQAQNKKEIINALKEFDLSDEKLKDILFLSGNKVDLALRLAENKDLFKKRKNIASDLKEFLLKEDPHEKEDILFNLDDLEASLNILLIMLRSLVLSSDPNSQNSFKLGGVLKKYNRDKLISIIKRVIKTNYFLNAYVNHKLALEYLIIGF